MTHLSRRTLLAGFAGLAGAQLLAPVLATPGFAAGPDGAAGGCADGVRRPMPSAHRYKVGDVEVTAIADGLRTFPLPDGFVRNASREEVNAALKAAFLPEDQISIPFTVLLLDVGGRRILIDTGNGPGQANVGFLRDTLCAVGIAPERIDEVVISHFHGDHINGLLDLAGRPAFPNARVRVPEREWAFFMDEGEMSRAPVRLKGVFRNARKVFAPFAGKVERFAWDAELAPGLKAVAAAGHTPGHTCFELASGDDMLFIQSDVTNIPALFVRHPEWQVMFDMDGPMAAEVRRRVYDRLVADRIKVAGYHFPFPGAAFVERDGAGYRTVPMPWNPLF